MGLKKNLVKNAFVILEQFLSLLIYSKTEKALFFSVCDSISIRAIQCTKFQFNTLIFSRDSIILLKIEVGVAPKNQLAWIPTF
jgi:hypothetical protein